MGDHWEGQAAAWVRWARTPQHDAYWRYREWFFDDIVPAPGLATLEVGCGEGRVARDLTERGHRVTAVDSSPTLVAHAAEADHGTRYLVADAAALPFDGCTFDLVVSYNTLMDVDDMMTAVAEAGRVLQPGGLFAVCVTHPMSDAGRFTSGDPAAPFLIEGSYRGRRAFHQTEERGGLQMDFRGWSYALEDYSRALEGAGLLIEMLREPPPRGREPADQRWHRIPCFLMFRARSSKRPRDPHRFE